MSSQQPQLGMEMQMMNDKNGIAASNVAGKAIVVRCAALAMLSCLPLAGMASAEFFNDVKIPMRDGANLAGDLYLPTNRAEKIGCFLSFSPYKATGGDRPWSADRAEE